MNYPKHLSEDARLAILTELARMTDGRMTVDGLVTAIEDWGHRKSDVFVRQQLTHLAEVEGVRLFRTGVALIAEITREGLNHVAKRSVLDGVKRPVPGE